MMTPSAPSRPASGVAPAQSGFSLVELMVALVLGLIVMAGMGSMYLANLRSYHTNTALEHIQNNTRIAYELMARDIRQTGQTGCNSKNNRVANILANGPYGDTAVQWWSDWRYPLRGHDDRQPTTAAAFGTGETDRVEGTDALKVLHVDGSGAGIQSTNADTGQFTLASADASMPTGSIVMACDPFQATLLQVTARNGEQLAYGGQATPGNCSPALGFPNQCNPAAERYTYAAGARVAPLVAHLWYVGRNPVGGRSLYRATLTNAGTPDIQQQEMVRHVTDLQITYHAEHGTTYVPAAGLGTSDWSKVDAVRIELILSGDHDTDAAAIQRQIAFIIAIRSRVN